MPNNDATNTTSDLTTVDTSIIIPYSNTTIGQCMPLMASYTTTDATSWYSNNVFTANFAKYTRTLNEEAFIKMLETMKADDYNDYINSLHDVIIHPGFRILSDILLTELIKDIEYLEDDRGLKIEDHYDLDEYDSFRALRKLR